MAIARAARTWLLIAGLLALLPGLIVSALQMGESSACLPIVPPAARSERPCGDARLVFLRDRMQQLGDVPCERCVHYLFDPADATPGSWRLDLQFEGLTPDCRYEVLHGQEFRAGPDGLIVEDLRRTGATRDAGCAPVSGGLRCAIQVAPSQSRAVFLTGFGADGPRVLAADGLVVSAWQTHSLGVLVADALRMLGLCAVALAACAVQFVRTRRMSRWLGLTSVGIGVLLLWARPAGFGGRGDHEASLAALAACLLAAWVTALSLALLRRVYRRGRVLAVLATGMAAVLGGILGCCVRQLMSVPHLLPPRHDLLLHVHAAVLACVCVGLVVLAPRRHDARMAEAIRRHFPRLPLPFALGVACMPMAVFTLPVAMLWGAARFGGCSIYYYSGMHQPAGLFLGLFLLAPTVLGLSLVAASRRSAGPLANERWHATPLLLVEVRQAHSAIRGTIRMRCSGSSSGLDIRQGPQVHVRHNGLPAHTWLAEDTASILAGLANAYNPSELSGSSEVHYDYDGQGDFHGRSYRLPLALLYLRLLRILPDEPILATGNLEMSSGRLTEVERIADKLAVLTGGELLLCPPRSLSVADSGVRCFQLTDVRAAAELARDAGECCTRGERVAIEVETLEIAVEFLMHYRSPRKAV